MIIVTGARITAATEKIAAAATERRATIAAGALRVATTATAKKPTEKQHE